MSTLDECIATLPYDGTVNEKLVQWLLANGATGGTLNELWHQFLDGQSVPEGTLNERKFTFYGTLSFTGTLCEREHDFFCDGAVIGPPPNVAYDFTIDNTQLDGRDEYPYSWTGVAAAGCNAIDNTGTPLMDDSDHAASFSFTNVTHDTTACATALFDFYISAVPVAGNIRIVLESNDVTGSTTYAAPSPKITDTIAGPPTYNGVTSNVYDMAATVGPHSINIKPLIDELFASGNWTYGSRVNVIILPNSAYVSANFGHFGASASPTGNDTPARLRIT